MESTEIYTYISTEAVSEAETPLPLSWGRLVCILTITAGLYAPYWFYRQWKDLKLEVWSSGHHPFLKSIGLLLPVISIFIFAQFFKQVSDALKDKRAQKVSPLLFTLFLIVESPLSYFSHFSLSADEDLNGLLTVILLSPLTLLEIYLFYSLVMTYRKEQGIAHERYHFFWGERFFMAACVMLWALILFGIFYLPDALSA